MKEIELTRGQVALVDDIDYEYLNQWSWHANWCYNCFRAVRSLPKVNGKRNAISMHTVIAERMEIDAKMIDHQDRNPLNNRRSNIRSCTVSQNNHNRGTQSNNKSGVKGVSFNKQAGKYIAQIEVKKKLFYLGLFDTVAEAAAVVQHKRKELVGEFTCD